jgi:hypothetical protein
MDNWLPDAPGTLKFGRTVLLKYGFRTHPERKHQLVSARDIGIAGATALNRSDVYANKEIPLAGDELTMDELEKVHQEVMGGPVETSMVALAWFARRYVPIARKVMDVSAGSITRSSERGILVRADPGSSSMSKGTMSTLPSCETSSRVSRTSVRGSRGTAPRRESDRSGCCSTCDPTHRQPYNADLL